LRQGFTKFLKLVCLLSQHKQRGCHASAVSGYTHAEQKLSKQQLIKVSLPWLHM